jgi:DNA-directed RNA polymerase specialized sigma24 family protein
VLSPRERACIVLRHFDDLPVSEIARALNLAEGSVKRYLSDATAKLRTTLAVVDASHEFESVPVIDRKGVRR